MTDSSFDSENFNCDSEIENETDSKSQKDEESKLKKEEIIDSISSTLTTILEENTKLPNYKEIILEQKNMCFNSGAIPKISIYDYLLRIQEYSNIEKNSLIISLIYIDRIYKIGKLILTHYNIHKILFTSILIAIKYNEDNFYDNQFYSEIAGIKLNELKLIEYNFLALCDFNMFVSDEIFHKYNIHLNSFTKYQLLIDN